MSGLARGRVKPREKEREREREKQKKREGKLGEGRKWGKSGSQIIASVKLFIGLIFIYMLNTS